MSGVTIYSTAVCPFCIAAKKLFKSQDIDFTEISLDHDPGLRMSLAEKNGGWRTVPMIFIGDRFIGGYIEARSLLQEGKLLPLVEEQR